MHPGRVHGVPHGFALDAPGGCFGRHRGGDHRARCRQHLAQVPGLRVGLFFQAQAPSGIALAGQQDLFKAFGLAQGVAALQQAHQGSRPEVAAAVQVAVFTRDHVGPALTPEPILHGMTLRCGVDPSTGNRTIIREVPLPWIATTFPASSADGSESASNFVSAARAASSCGHRNAPKKRFVLPANDSAFGSSLPSCSIRAAAKDGSKVANDSGDDRA